MLKTYFSNGFNDYNIIVRVYIMYEKRGRPFEPALTRAHLSARYLGGAHM